VTRFLNQIDHRSGFKTILFRSWMLSTFFFPVDDKTALRISTFQSQIITWRSERMACREILCLLHLSKEWRVDDILVTAPLLDNGSSQEHSRDEHQSHILNIGRTKISGLFFLRKLDKQIGMNWAQRRRGRQDVFTILVPYFF